MISGTSGLWMPDAHCGTCCCFSQTFDLCVKCSVSAADTGCFYVCVPRQIVSVAVVIVSDHPDSQHSSVDIRS